MIEANEYVRTDEGYIFKIDEEKKNLQIANFLDAEYGKIVKHSKQLIDLVEVGDIVNGHVVTNILDFKNGKKIEKMLYTEYVIPVLGKRNYIYATEVEIILTKERYMANCYKVGEEDE